MKLGHLEIPESPDLLLGRLHVYTEDYEPGRGRITIACFGEAWTCYWNAMSGKTVAEFCATCDSTYLVDCLLRGRKTSTRAHEDYLKKIVLVVMRKFNDRKLSIASEVIP